MVRPTALAGRPSQPGSKVTRPTASPKRSRLLRKNFGADEAKEFRDRNLNDTRYICRFFKNYVEHHLQLAPDSEANAVSCSAADDRAPPRARWGLLKTRSANDRHHALDAAVVAACTHGMVKRLADHALPQEGT